MNLDSVKTQRVYALLDPTTGEPRYIGITSVDVRQRLISHFVDSRRRNSPICFWLRGLTEPPKIEILDEGPHVSVEDEKEWIALYREDGAKLLNSNDGGPGQSYTWRVEHCRKIASVKREITSCPQGHEYTEENTYVNKVGTRSCITCRRARSRAFMATKRKATKNAQSHS